MATKRRKKLVEALILDKPENIICLQNEQVLKNSLKTAKSPLRLSNIQ